MEQPCTVNTAVVQILAPPMGNPIGNTIGNTIGNYIKNMTLKKWHFELNMK